MMRMAKDFIIGGDCGEEFHKALKKVSDFICKRPMDKTLWRFIFISIDYVDGTEQLDSFGSYMGEDFNLSEFTKKFLSNMQSVDKIKRYYVSGKVEKERSNS